MIMLFAAQQDRIVHRFHGLGQGQDMLRSVVFIFMALLTGCSSSPKGVECPGEVSTLYGQSLGQTQGTIFDLVTSFSVSRDGASVQSGPLQSQDRFQYIPSAVTREGYYAQRLSDKQFRLINPYQDTLITWTCP